MAAFNAALSRAGAGVLIGDVESPDSQVGAVAEIILTVRPDILLLNEFDHDPGARALEAFARLLRQGIGDAPGLDYSYLYHGPVNTGEPTGRDLDGDGRAAGPRDAFGFGRFPGQYGMALLSRFPIAFNRIRTYRMFRWGAMPRALRPALPDGAPYHDDGTWEILRLSSKSHWDVPVRLPDGEVLHVLAAHPTPPVFDGPEDLNGRRNADEIRLLSAMIEGADWLGSDQGRPSGLPEDAPFVILGDLNADPARGDSRRDGIQGLLEQPRIADPLPAGANDDATAFFARGPGAIRVDYALPSKELDVTGAGVFWPEPDHPLARLVGDGAKIVSSDHRLVWVDIRP